MDQTSIDRQELLSWAIQTLITASGQAMKQKNPGAVVACIRQLGHRLALGTTPTAAMSYAVDERLRNKLTTERRATEEVQALRADAGRR